MGSAEGGAAAVAVVLVVGGGTFSVIFVAMGRRSVFVG